MFCASRSPCAWWGCGFCPSTARGSGRQHSLPLPGQDVSRVRGTVLVPRSTRPMMLVGYAFIDFSHLGGKLVLLARSRRSGAAGILLCLELLLVGSRTIATIAWSSLARSLCALTPRAALDPVRTRQCYGTRARGSARRASGGTDAPRLPATGERLAVRCRAAGGDVLSAPAALTYYQSDISRQAGHNGHFGRESSQKGHFGRPAAC